MYVKVINGVPKPYTILQLRRDNPNTSFSTKISTQLLAQYGVYKAVEEERPSYNERTQSIAMNNVAFNSNGVWVYGWTIVDKTAEEIAAYDTEQSMSIRSQRDELLASCDWMAIKAFEAGSTLSAEWATYRQALRDVTAQAGFPHDVTFPTKPE